MADVKISALNPKTTVAPADILVIVDVTDTSMAPSGTDKKTTVSGLAAAVAGSINYLSPTGDGSALSVTASGASTPRTLAARSAEACNVKDFGAIGDGIADDTAAMQAAVDAAVATSRPLFLPGGLWTVTGLVARGRIDVIGAGVGASVIRAADGSAAPVLAVAVAPKTVPAAASLSTLTRSADFGFSGLPGDSHALSLTHVPNLKDTLDGLGDFTIEFVAESSNPDQSSWMQIGDVGLDGTNVDRLFLYSGGFYTLVLRLGQSNGTYVTTAFDTNPVVPSTTTAQHVAFVRSGTTVRTFVGGVLARTYSGVTGVLEVGPLDEVTLFSRSELPFFRLYSAGWARVDSIRILSTALYSATFTPPATVPADAGALLWWNADQPQSGGTTPVYVGGPSPQWAAATIQQPYNFASQDCALSTFRDFTIRESAIGLHLSGAPGCRIERVDGYNCRVPIWLEDNCYYSSIRDCQFEVPDIGILAHSASGELSIDNVVSSFTRSIGFATVNLQGCVHYNRCAVGGSYAAAFVVAGCDTVAFSTCDANEENHGPGPVIATWVLSDTARVALRDCEHGGGVAVAPAILDVATSSANGLVRVEGSRFFMNANSAAVVEFVGSRPALQCRIDGSDRTPANIPWVPAGQAAYVDVDNTLTGLSFAGGTAGRVVIQGTGGVLADSNNLTFVGGVFTVLGTASVDNTAAGDGGYYTGFTVSGHGATIILADTSGGQAPFRITSAFGQLYYVNINTGATLAACSAAGDWTFGSANAEAGVRMLVSTASTTSAGVAIRGIASQSAPLVVLQGISSTGTARDLAYVDASFSVSTDGIYRGRLSVRVQDSGNNAGGHLEGWEGIAIESGGTAALVGFFGATPSARPTIAGSRGGNAALASLLTGLANLGLIIDSTT